MRKLVAILIIFFVGMYLGNHFYGPAKEAKVQTVVVHDTVAKAVLKTIVKKDTVIRWKEKIQWKKTRPETVVVYKERVELRDIYGTMPEMMLNLWKNGDRLRIQGAKKDTSGWQIRDYLFRLDRYATEYSVFTVGEGFFREGEEAMADGAWNIYRDRMGQKYKADSYGRAEYEEIEMVYQSKRWRWCGSWNFV